jgi:ubiquinone/menaquinone biosynthesis C-methylase UbiE
MELRTHRGHPTPKASFWESYFDFPELYDRFAISTLYAVGIVHQLVDFRAARVLDVASGTGKNALEHAKIARSVVGIEPKPRMREFAIARASRLQLKNVEFRDGIAEDLTAFEDGSFDVAVSMYGAPFPWDTEHRFVHGCERVVREGGHVVIVGTSPGWKALHARSTEAETTDNPQWLRTMDDLRRMGLQARDFVVDMDYGTVQEALETFGFIHGPAAIDFILDNETSRQEFGVRVFLRTV